MKNDCKFLQKAKAKEDAYLDKKMFITRREMMELAEKIGNEKAAAISKEANRNSSQNIMALYDSILRVSLVRIGFELDKFAKLHDEVKKVEREFRQAINEKSKKSLSKLCTLYDIDSKRLFQLEKWQIETGDDDGPIIEVYEEPDQKWIVDGRVYKCPVCGRKTVIHDMFCPKCGTRLR